MITLERHLPDVYGSPEPERPYDVADGCGPSDYNAALCRLHEGEELCEECGHAHAARLVWAYDWSAPVIENDDLGTRSQPITQQWWCAACVESSRRAGEAKRCRRCGDWFHVDVDECAAGVCMSCDGKGVAA